MAKDKQKDKEQFVEELMDLYEDRHEENGSNPLTPTYWLLV